MIASFARSLSVPARWRQILYRPCVGIATVLGLGAGAAIAEDIRVGVAANFLTTAEALAEVYERDSGHYVILASGSTGGLYAQIRHGADYDLLLAADQARPALLEEEGRAVAGSRFTYALGRLSLWSASDDIRVGPDLLREGTYRHLAIANPDLAPYGVAAQDSLIFYEAWTTARQNPRKLVMGQNIGQTAAMVASGNAELGLVATSFLITQSRGGSRWDIPAEAHAPIRQDAVLLDGDNAVAVEFLEFLQSDVARDVMRAHGYEVPE